MPFNRMTAYKGYIITTWEGTEKGIFFRNPLQTVWFVSDYDESTLSAWKYLNAIKNPFRKLYEILIGNGEIVKNIKAWSNEIDWAGFRGHLLCSPIYFKREYRKLEAVSAGNNDIAEINSYGFDNEFIRCAGECNVEKTVIKLSNGKTLKYKRKNLYHFTYEHVIKELIDSGGLPQ